MTMKLCDDCDDLDETSNQLINIIKEGDKDSSFSIY